MTSTDTPDPDFVNGLERELRSTLRRQATLNGEGSGRRGANGKNRVRFTRAMIVVAALSMCVGGAATYAVTRGLDNRMADLVIARAEALSEFADMRLELVREGLEERMAEVEEGVVPAKEQLYIEMELRAVESEADRCALNLEETRLTRREPNDALSAPLVGGRDFVTERLELERNLMLHRLHIIETEADDQEPGSTEAAAVNMDMTRVHSAVTSIGRRMALRRAFLDGELTAAEVELKNMRWRAIEDRKRAARQLEQATEAYGRMEAMFDKGLVSATDLRAMEVELQGVKLQFRMAELELEMLERKLAGAYGR